jgi:hypothetical protein
LTLSTPAQAADSISSRAVSFELAQLLTEYRLGDKKLARWVRQAPTRHDLGGSSEVGVGPFSVSSAKIAFRCKCHKASLWSVSENSIFRWPRAFLHWLGLDALGPVRSVFVHNECGLRSTRIEGHGHHLAWAFVSWRRVDRFAAVETIATQ